MSGRICSIINFLLFHKFIPGAHQTPSDLSVVVFEITAPILMTILDAVIKFSSHRSFLLSVAAPS